jgi:hypothetical protein
MYKNATKPTKTHFTKSNTSFLSIKIEVKSLLGKYELKGKSWKLDMKLALKNLQTYHLD